MVLINLNHKQMCHHEWAINPLLNVIAVTFHSMSAPIYYFLGCLCRKMLSFFLCKAQLQKWKLYPRSKYEVRLNSHIKLWRSVLVIKCILTLPGTLLTCNDLATNGVDRWLYPNWLQEEEWLGEDWMGRGSRRTLSGNFRWIGKPPKTDF